jgi:hypothetical protein
MKGGNLIENHTPLPYGLRNPYRNLKSENSQDYTQKPQRDSTFMNSASGLNGRGMTFGPFIKFLIRKYLVWQHVLPDVLRVREPCLRRADPSQDSKLATPLQVLSLVSHFLNLFLK